MPIMPPVGSISIQAAPPTAPSPINTVQKISAFRARSYLTLLSLLFVNSLAYYTTLFRDVQQLMFKIRKKAPVLSRRASEYAIL